jgi:serine/threonine protein kinase
VAQHHFRCDTNRLRLLLEDALPTPKEAEVVHHLDDCRQCQETLEKLAADRNLWDELPKLNELTNSPEVPARGGHEAATSPEIADATADAQGGPFSLDFLDPAEDPGHLGRLDRFAVTELLGRGGMGVVLKAIDAALNRPVAIKVLAPYFASSGAARQRFAREARAAATVVHPNVVAIHAVDACKGLPYLVMSYVAGRSLQERLDSEGPLDIKEVVRIGMQTASGLAAAHAQGIVHRDVKPANILLENGVGRVWLTDFGLARAVDDASLTQSGVIAGTPQYMAPEQALGHAVDHRADLFSLGSTLYAMCTAHAPFRAETAMAVLRRVCDDAPRPLRTLNPEVPTWLARIVAKLHAKNPADRFQTAAEVADLLEKCLAHLQQPDTNALPAGLSALAEAKSKPHRLRRPALLIAPLLCVSALVGLGWSWLANQPSGDPQDGGVSKQNVSRDAPSLDARIDVPRDREIDMERQLGAQIESIRGRMAAVQADLTQPSAAGIGDPASELLEQTRHRLDALQRELAIKQP